MYEIKYKMMLYKDTLKDNGTIVLDVKCMHGNIRENCKKNDHDNICFWFISVTLLDKFILSIFCILHLYNDIH